MPDLPSITDYLSGTYWAGFLEDKPLDLSYIGSGFFPEQEVGVDKLEWDIIKSESQLAPFVAVDAESPRMEAELLTKAWAEIAFMRLKKVLIESDCRQVRMFGD